MEKKVNRRYFIGEPEGFPEIADGQVLYDIVGNKLYVDINNERKLVSEILNINSDVLDDSSDLPTSKVVATAINTYIENASTWKSDGYPQDVLSKNDSGDLSWMNIQNALYWYEPLRSYGVEWNYAGTSPQLTRTNLASDFSDPVPATSINEVGSSPFDDIYPWSEMKEVNILSDGTIIQKEDSSFSYNNDTMVYIPEFYYKAVKNIDDQKWTWQIAETGGDGFTKHPGSGRYIGRYHMSGTNPTKLFSKTATKANAYYTYNEIANEVHNSKGTNWYMLDIDTWSAVQMLYLIEFANFNSNAILGSGQNNGKPLGDTNNALYHTISASNASNQYRWIENPYSAYPTWVYGFTGKQTDVNINHDLGSNTLGVKSNITLPPKTTSVIDDVISGFGYDENNANLFIPDSIVTDSTGSTYTCNFYSQKNTYGNYKAIISNQELSGEYRNFFMFDCMAIDSPCGTSRFVYVVQ